MGGVLLLAVVLGAGPVPVPDAIVRFPDSSYYSESGPLRDANMLAAVASQGARLREVGPGPQQLAARWEAGRLNAAERVAVLLAGAGYHDPALLPVYAEALRSPVVRERQAAAVGLHWLLGLPPPAPSVMVESSHGWDELAGLASRLAEACRTKTLLSIWVDSYLAAIGEPLQGSLTLKMPPEVCLAAIRELAEPEDLGELLALWPLLASDQDRFGLLRTIEMVTLQRLVDAPLGPRAPSGESYLKAGVSMVDGWVAGLCHSIDGEGYMRATLRRFGLLDNGKPSPRTWLRILMFKYPSIWPIAIERLSDLGAPVVVVDRQRLSAPVDSAKMLRLKDYFPISTRLAGAAFQARVR
jgi:hypothetical protein